MIKTHFDHVEMSKLQTNTCLHTNTGHTHQGKPHRYLGACLPFCCSSCLIAQTQSAPPLSSHDITADNLWPAHLKHVWDVPVILSCDRSKTKDVSLPELFIKHITAVILWELSLTQHCCFHMSLQHLVVAYLE